MQALRSLNEDEHMPLAVEAWNLNHWTHEGKFSFVLLRNGLSQTPLVFFDQRETFRSAKGKNRIIPIAS